MNCPNCGFEQPESQECIRCGIVFRKYQQHLELISDPAGAIKKIVVSFAGKMQYRDVFFAPDIPDELLCEAWLTCAQWDVADPEEEALMLCESRLTKKSAPETLLLTTRGIIVLSDRHPYVYDYGIIKKIDITGTLSPALDINTKSLNPAFLGAMSKGDREVLKTLLQAILKIVRSTVRGGTWKPRVRTALDKANVPDNFLLRQSGKEPLTLSGAEALMKAKGRTVTRKAAGERKRAGLGWKIFANAIGLVAGLLLWALAIGILAGYFKVPPGIANFIGPAVGLFTWISIAGGIIRTVEDFKNGWKT